MKRIISCILLFTYMGLFCTAQDNPNMSCTLKVSIPKGMVKNASTADFTISLNGENGDEDIATLTLKSTPAGILSGEWVTQVHTPVSASALWTEDPHVGFSFVIEPGIITVTPDGQGAFNVSGTKLNDAYAAFQSERNAADYSKADSIVEAYMQKYSDTPLFGTLFTTHSATMFGSDKQKVEALWAMGGENGKKMKYALEAYNRICHNDINNGEPLRDVEIPNATVEDTGKSVRLSDYIGKGKWVFVDFWASWCVGCRQAIPIVKKAYEQVKDNGNIMFISIAEWDKRPAALKAMKEENMPWLQLIDEKGLCGSTYLFNTIPRFMLFTPDGSLYDKDVQRNNILNLLTHLDK